MCPNYSESGLARIVFTSQLRFRIHFSEINFKRRKEIELVVIIRKKERGKYWHRKVIFYAWILTSYWGRQKKGRSEMITNY